MCIQISQGYVLRKGDTVESEVYFRCGRCWQCNRDRVNDWTGRALAEAAYSSGVQCLTLTYRDQDDLSHRVITKSHLQKFIRALRRRGHVLKYIAVGEYGDQKGRAHFHCVLFFKTPVPASWPRGRNIRGHIPEWPHGHVNFDGRPVEPAVRYVLKYVLKGADTFRTLSKKPPIGDEFFAQKAREVLEAGVFPQSFRYAPPGGTPGRSYVMTGATRRNYLFRIMEGYGWLTGGARIPEALEAATRLVEAWAVEKEERDRFKADPQYAAELLAEQALRLRRDLDDSRMTGLQAERFCNSVAIALYDAAQCRYEWGERES